MRQRRRHAGAALVVAGLLASVPAGLANAASGRATASDKAQATKGLLVLSDLPKGWSAGSTSSTSSGNFTGAPQLARCIGVPTQLIQITPPRVDSPSFQDTGGTQQAQNTISIYPSARYATAEFAALTRRKTAGCLTALLNGTTVGGSAGSSASGTTAAAFSATVTRLSSPSGTGAYAVETSITSQGTSTPTRTQLAFFVRGRFVDAIDVVSSGPPASSLSPLASHLLTVARSRL